VCSGLGRLEIDDRLELGRLGDPISDGVGPLRTRPGWDGLINVLTITADGRERWLESATDGLRKLTDGPSAPQPTLLRDWALPEHLLEILNGRVAMGR
jgi:hypothetical protein